MVKSPNNRISSDGNVCPKSSVPNRLKKKTIAIALTQKFGPY